MTVGARSPLYQRQNAAWEALQVARELEGFDKESAIESIRKQFNIDPTVLFKCIHREEEEDRRLQHYGHPTKRQQRAAEEAQRLDWAKILEDVGYVVTRTETGGVRVSTKRGANVWGHTSFDCIQHFVAGFTQGKGHKYDYR